MTMTDTLTALTGKPLGECTNGELYLSLLKLVNEKAAQQIRPVQGRKLYYISAEFLIGKLLSNNLINLGLYDEVRALPCSPPERSFPTLKRWSRSLLLATAAWAVWRPASWIPWLP